MKTNAKIKTRDVIVEDEFGVDIITIRIFK